VVAGAADGRSLYETADKPDASRPA